MGFLQKYYHTLCSKKLLGGILVSLRPSVHLSVRSSVRPSVLPAFRVRSVLPTVLVGSISYFDILSSNFRRCVACKVSCKILKFGFLPEASFGLRVLSLPPSVCLCVCVCGNHLLVRAITCRPFKLESPNLDQKSKTPWLRSLLFWGLIDLELQGQI